MAFVIKAFVNRADKDPNIGLIEKISYGLGDFSSQLLLTPVSMLPHVLRHGIRGHRHG